MLNKGLYEQFTILKKGPEKFEFLVHEVLYMQDKKTKLTLTQSKQNYLALNYIPHCSVSSVVWLVHRVTPSKLKKNERWLAYKQTRRDLYLCGDSFGRYSERCFTKIYRALFGDVT